MAAAGVVAAALAALVVLPHAGNGSAGSLGAAHAQPLVTLANHVAVASVEGDATLVQHSNAVQGEQPFTGADLYLDDGRYYYAATSAGLPAAVQAGPQPDFSLKPVIDAMASTSSADPADARAAFLKAVDPLYGGDVQTESAASQDNVIWVAAMDVLGAAYGRPGVLAGTLRALSTVNGVSVTHGTLDGAETLEISIHVPAQTSNLAALKRSLDARLKAAGDLDKAQAAALRAKLDAQPSSVVKSTVPAHDMVATLDAQSGALMRYTDIGLVVTYHVSRVDAGQYGAR
jgi:hypothetical protein